MPGRRFRRWIAWGALAAGALAVALFAGGAFLLRSDAGRALLAGAIADTLSTSGGAGVSIGRLDGALPGEIVVRDVAVRDRDGVWLTLASARLAWRPWALFGRRVVIESLTVDGLAVSRAPAGDAMPERQRSAIPRDLSPPALPVDVRLAAFDFDNVALGADLLGEAVTLRATGRFGIDTAGDARGTARIERTDGAPLTATLDAVLESATRTLDIDLALAEPAGGLVARLAGLPDLPALSFSLKGRGPAGDWRGRLAAEAAGLASLDADVTIGIGERVMLGLAGAADIGRLIEPDLAVLTGPMPRFDVLTSLDDDDVLRLERARVTGAAVEAEIGGRIELDDLRSDLDVAARLVDPAVVARFADGVSVRDGTVAATLRGPPERLAVAVRADIAGAAAAGVAIERIAATVDAVVRPQRIDGDFGVELTGISGDPQMPELAGLPRHVEATGTAALDLPDQTIELSSLRVVGDDIALTGDATVDLAQDRIGLDAEAAIGRLAPFAALAGVDLAGRADATIALDSTDLGGSVAGALDLRLADLASTDLPLAPLLGRSARLTAKIGRLSADGIAVPELMLAGDNLDVTGRVEIAAAWSTLTADARVGSHALAAWTEQAGIDLSGSLTGNVTARGALDDPGIVAEIDLASVTVAGTGPLGGRVTARADAVVTAPAGDIALKLTGPYGPVDASTEFALRDPDRLALDAIRVSALGAQARGQFAAGLSSGIVAGRIDATVDDLAAAGELVGVPLRGAATARLTLAGEQQRQTGALSLSAPSLALPQPDGSTIELTGVAAEATLDGLAPQPAGRADIAIATATVGELRLKDLALRLTGTPAALAFDLRGAGALAEPFDVAAGGSAALAPGGWSLSLDRLTGRAAGHDVALEAPAMLSVTAGRVALSPTALRVGAGRLQAEAALDAGRVAARLDATGLPLSLAALADARADLAGTVSASATLEGDPADPTGAAELRLAEVALRDLDAAGEVVLHGNATARLASGRLAMTADIGGFAEQGLTLDAGLPLRLALRPVDVSLPPDGALRGTVDWRGEVATLWEVLPLDDHRLTGVAEISATAAGTVADPSVTGSVRFSEGRYENLSIGTVLDSLTLDASVDQGRELSIALTGTDGGKGTVSGKGAATLDPIAGFPLHVDLSFADATLVRRDEVTLAAGGALALRGDAAAMTLTGRIETTRIEARLDEALPPSVVDLGVVEASGPNARDATADESPGLLTLDLDIVVPGQAFVRGRGLDTEWRGELHVSGDAGEPAIEGTMSFVRGQFSFAGKRFTLDGSKIDFDGATKVDPLLDIRAEHAADDVTGIILITGRASNPEIELTSRPALPQDEILARVLFGKSAGALTPVEAVQLAAAVAQLSGAGPGGAGVLDKVRDALGVDVLEVGAAPAGSDGASLRAGRYINEQTFVGVTQGTTPGSTGVTVEIEVMPNVVVDTEVDQGGTTKSGIKWKYDY
jgi:translocation and assembly module TamB